MKKSQFWENIKIDESSGVPKYKQLQSQIERLIADNLLLVNTRIPGENEFFSRLGFSRTTTRMAMQALEDANLIYRVQGQGTFIGSKRNKPLSNESNGIVRSGKHKQIIGVVLPNITNEIYPFITNGIEQIQDTCVFSANSGGSSQREINIINDMIASSVDGLIIEPLYSRSQGENSPLVSLIKKINIPVVLINNDIPEVECSKVMQDDEGGGRLVTEHLLENGHRRIAYIYNDRVSAAFERLNGYRAALAAAGIPHDPALEIPYNDEQGQVFPGYILTKQLLEDTMLGVTAIFYFNDDLALQGLAAAKSLNLEIPRDLSIVGYDDIPRSRLSGVQLTTVSHPKTLLGSWAASLLLEQFTQTDKPIYRKITVHSSMVYRGSVLNIKGGLK